MVHYELLSAKLVTSSQFDEVQCQARFVVSLGVQDDIHIGLAFLASRSDHTQG